MKPLLEKLDELFDASWSEDVDQDFSKEVGEFQRTLDDCWPEIRAVIVAANEAIQITGDKCGHHLEELDKALRPFYDDPS